MARTDPQINIRLPADLKDRLENAAREGNRSTTAEIVSRLMASFEANPANEALQNAFDEALSKLERSIETTNRQQLEAMQFAKEQMVAMSSLLETIAETDGNLDEDFMKAIRALVAEKGKYRSVK